MFKSILLILLLLTVNSFAVDKRLENYPKATKLYKEATQNKSQVAAFDLALFYEDTLKDSKQTVYWYKKSYEYGSSSAALNLGLHYLNLKDYPKTIEWFEKAYNRNDTKSAFNLGMLYDDRLKDYPKAIEWYKKSYAQGNMGGANNLGYLYKVTLKDEAKGAYWYEKAAQGGDFDAVNGLAGIYHSRGDNVTASAYLLAMIDHGHSKEEVLAFLKNNWKIDRSTLEKAYKLQQTLDIPKHYTGGID